MAYVLDDKEGRKGIIEDVSVIQECEYVFPEDFPGVRPERHMEFRIDLVPSTDLIVNAPNWCAEDARVIYKTIEVVRQRAY